MVFGLEARGVTFPEQGDKLSGRVQANRFDRRVGSAGVGRRAVIETGQGARHGTALHDPVRPGFETVPTPDGFYDLPPLVVAAEGSLDDQIAMAGRIRRLMLRAHR